MNWRRDAALHRELEERLHAILPHDARSLIKFCDSGYFDHEREFGLMVAMPEGDVEEIIHVMGAIPSDQALVEAIRRLTTRILEQFRYNSEVALQGADYTPSALRTSNTSMMRALLWGPSHTNCQRPSE